MHGVGGAVLVRGLEWSSEPSATERTASDAADERVRHAVLHPAAGLRTAAGEFPFDWTQVWCKVPWSAKSDLLQCCFSGQNSADVHHRAAGADLQWKLSGEDRSSQSFGSLHTVSLSERGRTHRTLSYRFLNHKGSVLQAVIFFPSLLSGCDVCGGHGQHHPCCPWWSISKRPRQGSLVPGQPHRHTYR